MIIVLLAMISLTGNAMAAEEHEHHATAEEHQQHVESIREAIEIVKGEHPDLAERLEKVAEHHETI